MFDCAQLQTQTEFMGAAKGILIGIGVGLFAGLLFRLAFAFEGLQPYFSVMSIGFLFAAPFVVGFLSINYIQRKDLSKVEAFFWPVIPITLGCITTYALYMEGKICIIMYLPAAIILAGLGGLIARSSKLQNKNSALAVLALPFVIQLAENKMDFAIQNHRVQNTIEIQGTATDVWNEIKSVKTIQTHELKDSWVHKMGFPRPLDAEIDKEDIGGIRTARFERGLVFVETVNEWIPNQRLAFRIDVDPKDIPPTALDEHVTIGGPFFDVLDGIYQIEDHGNGRVTLHLQSQFRLSTHFNSYAGVWTDLIMHQIQSDILSVVKQRVEKVTNTKI